MNYLGIDFGEKKIGLSLSAGEIARPFLVLRVKSPELGIAEIKEICEEEEVEKIIVGFPESDKNSEIAAKIKQFAANLSQAINLPLVFQDETLTSYEALQKMIVSGKSMKKRRKEDAFAAAIILQDYLDKLKINKEEFHKPYKNIIINNDILYTNYDGTDSLGLIGQAGVMVGMISENDLKIDGALIAQNDRVGRFYYTGGSCAYKNRSVISLFGMIASYVRYGFAYTNGTGYATRNITYDANLLYAPPPDFPLTSDHYQIISWQEVKN